MRRLAIVWLTSMTLFIAGCGEAPQPRTIGVRITEDGSYVVDGKRIPEDELTRALKDLQERPGSLAIQVQTDEHTPMAAVGRLTVAAGKAGVSQERISMVVGGPPTANESSSRPSEAKP